MIKNYHTLYSFSRESTEFILLWADLFDVQIILGESFGSSFFIVYIISVVLEKGRKDCHIFWGV